MNPPAVIVTDLTSEELARAVDWCRRHDDAYHLPQFTQAEARRLRFHRRLVADGRLHDEAPEVRPDAAMLCAEAERHLERERNLSAWATACRRWTKKDTGQD